MSKQNPVMSTMLNMLKKNYSNSSNDTIVNVHANKLIARLGSFT